MCLSLMLVCLLTMCFGMSTPNWMVNTYHSLGHGTYWPHLVCTYLRNGKCIPLLWYVFTNKISMLKYHPYWYAHTFDSGRCLPPTGRRVRSLSLERERGTHYNNRKVTPPYCQGVLFDGRSHWCQLFCMDGVDKSLDQYNVAATVSEMRLCSFAVPGTIDC